MTTENTYDAQGRVESQTQVRQTGAATTTFYYSDYLTTQVGPNGERSQTHLDRLGRVDRVVNALGHITQQATPNERLTRHP